MQHLAVEQIVLDVLDDDSLIGQLIVDPIDQGVQQFLDLWFFQRLGLDDGTFLIITWREIKMFD